MFCLCYYGNKRVVWCVTEYGGGGGGGKSEYYIFFLLALQEELTDVSGEGSYEEKLAQGQDEIEKAHE